MTGTAKNAPTIPNRVLPATIAISTIPGCRSIDLLCRIGNSTLPSSCCTAKTNTKTITAVPKPLDTRATRTAKPPATKAPTTGMKAPKNVSTASANASGTPAINSPEPIRVASISPTSA